MEMEYTPTSLWQVDLIILFINQLNTCIMTVSKYITALAAVCLLFGFMACTSDDENDNKEAPLVEPVKLVGQDSVQMKSLEANAIDQINAISFIIGRALDVDFGDLHSLVVEKDPKTDDIMIEVIPLDDQITLGYYCEPEGTCQIEPCGKSVAKPKPLKPLDVFRMKKAKESLLSSLNEASTLIGKSLRKDFSATKRWALVLKQSRNTIDIEVEPLDDEITLGWWCDPPGVCQSTPCGN